ncbi:ComEC/Rec2 family competence protein [Sandarakinorhabdus sp. DWP1-3-1]|uniref:ComEC/Rec2 family competence protein n=1 Tax=Sandarakinorhabdus sp. DWP1-3-1 TaxID=2804627 RepID=UPI003CF9DBDD
MTARWWALVDAERESVALWLPVAFGAGIAAWFVLPWAEQRLAAAVLCLGLALAGGLSRLRPLLVAGLLALAGMGVAEWRSARVAHPVLAARPVASVTGIVTGVENRADRRQIRLLVAPDAGSGLPPLVRLTVRGKVEVAPGARVAVRAMLSPPAAAAVPGGYDFARRAWFAGIGATGFPMGPVRVLAPAPPPAGPLAWLAAARGRLTARIVAAVPGESGAIAAAFVTGDQGAIPIETAQAMRDSGLAHLLSISGLHIAVVVGGAIFLVRRTLTLSPWIALRWPVKTIAVAVAAVIGVAYTLLAGGEVPTVRTILATLIVLVGMVLGREAFSLRLLAAASFIILAVRPEALLGASFQLSFAAVIAIVALYESRLGRWLTTPQEDEHPLHRLGRHLLSLLVSGLVAELALSSIGLFHFNRAGLYGVLANLVAIPLASFVIMPALVLALLADVVGLGAWAWPLVGLVMGWLVEIAHAAAALPCAVVRRPAMPVPAYALIIAGGLWLALWRSRLRWWGAGAAALGVVLAMAAAPADLLVSSDGRNAAVRLPDGRLAFLRARTGSFLKDVWGDALAAEGDAAFVDLPGMACSGDACVSRIHAGGRDWRLLATLSRDYVARASFEPACAAADIVISDRRLPGWCRPRWLKLDRTALADSGAVAIWLGERRVETVHDRIGDHPWRPVSPVRRWQRRLPSTPPSTR